MQKQKFQNGRLMTSLAADTAEKWLNLLKEFNHLLFAAAAWLAPTANISVMTSRGMPFVSGTFK